jgi:hypothetical protein
LSKDIFEPKESDPEIVGADTNVGACLVTADPPRLRSNEPYSFVLVMDNATYFPASEGVLM